MNKRPIQFVFNSFSPTGLDDYERFYASYFSDFVALVWKFPHSKGKHSSRLSVYSAGKKLEERALPSLKVRSGAAYFLTLPFHYLLYLLQALTKLPRREPGVVRIYMGINYFCALCGIVLKKLGKADHVVYRVMDFFPTPDRGAYRYLMWIFYAIDRFCLSRADEVWFTTEGHIIGREKYGYYDRNKARYSMIPLGVDTSRYVCMPLNERRPNSLVYVGVVSRYHLVDLLFDVVARLVPEFPDVGLDMIGSGPDLDFFREEAARRGLRDRIVFRGFMDEGEAFTHIVAGSLLGIAFYRDEEGFMKYTEPAKVKYYLNYGVPAVVSRVPRIASELETEGVAFACENDAEIVAAVIRRFFSDREAAQKTIDAIGRYIRKVDINTMLTETTGAMLRRLHLKDSD